MAREYVVASVGADLASVPQAREYVPGNVGVNTAATPDGFECVLVGNVEAEVPKLVQVWDGAAWVDCPLRYWNGRGWVTGEPLRYWDGSAWITV